MSAQDAGEATPADERPLLNGKAHAPRRQGSQTGYGAVDGEDVPVMTGNLPEDRAGQSEEGGVEAAQDVPVQTPEVDQGVGQSSSVLLPEEVLRRTFGDRTELLNLVRSLQTLAGLPVEGADGDDEGGGDVSQENYVSAGEGEQIPPGLLSSGVSARPQGTPDFPHRVEEPPPVFLPPEGPGLLHGGLTFPQRGPAGPLFGPEMVARWAQLENEAPLLYGASSMQGSLRPAPRSEAPSVLSSGEIQAEVRRQLESIRLNHAVQMEALVRENEALRSQLSGGLTQTPEPRRWANTANRVMDWFRGGIPGGSSSVPPGTNPILRSLGNLIPKAPGKASRRSPEPPSPDPPAAPSSASMNLPQVQSVQGSVWRVPQREATAQDVAELTDASFLRSPNAQVPQVEGPSSDYPLPE